MNENVIFYIYGWVYTYTYLHYVVYFILFLLKNKILLKIIL